MVKVNKVLDLMDELGITLAFPYSNPESIMHAVRISDGDKTYDLIGVENDGIDSFGRSMTDFKLVQYDDPRIQNQTGPTPGNDR